MPSKIYSELPAEVVAACEDIVRAYALGSPPAADRELLRTVPALIFAEAVALEAVDMLAKEQGSTSDLFLAELLNEAAFEPLTPAMLPLLRFLRGRLAGHDPVLRLDSGTPEPALTMLLMAGQALVSAADQPPGGPRVAALLDQCLARLAADPADQRVSAGDLGFGLSDDEPAGTERSSRDETRKFLTGTEPLLGVFVAPDGTILLWLDLAARPDLKEVFHLLVTDLPEGGADTWIHWQGFGSPDGGMVRLNVEWFQPVHASLAVILDTDEHARVLDVLTKATVMGLVADRPRPDHPVDQIRIPANGPILANLLSEVAALGR